MANDEITARRSTSDQLSAVAVCKAVIIPNSRQWSYREITDTATPYCDIVNKEICSPLFSSSMPQKDYEIVAGKLFHESAHAAYTSADVPISKYNPKLVHKVLNHIEDKRVEWIVGKDNAYISKCLNTLNAWGSESVNTCMSENGGKIKPIDEALFAMNLTDSGELVEWELSTMAKKMLDRALPVFSSWRGIANVDKKDGYKNLFPIADEIIKIFAEVIEEQNSEPDKNSGEDEGGKSADGKKQEDKNDTKNDDNENTDSENGENTDNKHSGNQKKNTDSENGENTDSENGENTDNKYSGNQKENKDKDKGADESDGGDSKEKTKDDGGKKNTNTLNDDISDESASGKDEATSPYKENPSHKLPAKAKMIDKFFDNENFLSEKLEKKMREICKNSDDAVRNYRAYTINDKIVVASPNAKEYQKSKDEIGGHIASMSRHFQQVLQTLSAKYSLTMRDRGNIDMHRLTQAAIGSSNRVFYKEIDGCVDLNVALTILVDESGSMYNSIDEVRKLAIAFAESFDKLKINFEVLGFSTNYPDLSALKNSEWIKFDRLDALLINEYKTFTERFQAVKTRMGSMIYRKNNIDGESLQIAYRRNIAQKANRHIVLVLSDGEPEAMVGRGSLSNHLISVVENIRKAGGEVYAFGLCTRAPKEFYGKDFFVYLNSIKKLGPEFLKKVSDILIKGRKNTSKN